MGMRRMAAAKLAGLEKVPAMIIDGPLESKYSLTARAASPQPIFGYQFFTKFIFVFTNATKTFWAFKIRFFSENTQIHIKYIATIIANYFYIFIINPFHDN